MIVKGPVKTLLLIAFLLLLLLPSLSYSVPIKSALAIELNSINDIVNNFTKNLSDEINDIVANAINSSIWAGFKGTNQLTTAAVYVCKHR